MTRGHVVKPMAKNGGPKGQERVGLSRTLRDIRYLLAKKRSSEAGPEHDFRYAA